MKNLILALSFLIGSVSSANPHTIFALSSLLKVETKSDIEKMRNDLNAVEKLECFEGNRFVTHPLLLEVVALENEVFTVTPPGFIESIFWGQHASSSYKALVSSHAFFNFPTSVWTSLPGGKIEMIVSIDHSAKTNMSSIELESRFPQEVQNLKQLVPSMKVRCVQDRVRIAWAKQLLSLVEASSCEGTLKYP